MLGKKRKKPLPPDDDGRTIAEMNVEGMPWYNPTAGKVKEEDKPTRKEKRALVEFSLRQKSHSYLGHDVAMTDEVADILCKCSVEIADGVIDKILTANRFSEGFETITAEMLSPYTDLLNTHSGYGFGGSNL